jgi:CHASE3 domain sensor protein
MTIDEGTRHHVHVMATRCMDERAADGLMDMLPPVGWADVATKHDLAELEHRIDLRFDAVDARFDAVNSRFDAVNTRFEAVNSRFDQVNTRFDQVDARFDQLKAELIGELHRTLNAQTKTLFFSIITVLTGIAAIAIAWSH